MRNFVAVTVLLALCLCVIAIQSAECLAQATKQAVPSKRIGGPFENAEYLYYGMPSNPDPISTSPGWSQNGQKLIVSGTIYKRGGKTPAPGIVLYYYHTDIHGFYSAGVGLDERAIRHGYIRGWVKSDANGRYTIRTVRPVSYPNESIPSHIHVAVKEPEWNEYYVDDLVFEDDPLLTPKLQKKMENRGGSGILRPQVAGDLLIAEHDFILGLNIPDYPEEASDLAAHGLQIGEEFPSFIPFHAWGPDRGSQACPVCKYGRYQGVVYVVDNHPNWTSIEAWLRFLEDESNARGEYLKVYFVYGNGREFEPNLTRSKLESIGNKLGIASLALTFVPSLKDPVTEVNLLKIAPDAESTMLLYRQRVVVDKFVNLQPLPENFSMVSAALERTKSKLQEARAQTTKEGPIVKLNVPSVVVDGSNPSIQASGLTPKEVVRIHVLRSLEKWKEHGGQWQRARQSIHAFADFMTDENGTVHVDKQTPVKGTYSIADPLALLRTGYRFGDPALQGVHSFSEEPLASQPESRVWVKLERNGQITAEADFELTGTAKGVEVAQKMGDGWHAIYARPADRSNLPVVISLHGSEGGSLEKARGRASLLASNGFAAVGVNYFAYPHESIKGIPTQHAEINLEILESIREWLTTRPEIDANRIHLVGVSKGAEFALLAATQFDWIKSVVAVVPSDVVWEGYAEGGGKGTVSSSWAVGGKPTPFVPLFPFDPKMEGMYRSNTERYTRSRDFHYDRVAPARIPIENAKARILLLASDLDEVWASGAMARNLVERLNSAGKSELVEAKIYPKAGHQIAGTGTFPVRLYGEQSSDPQAKDIIAEGESAADAWRRTIQFLSQ